MNETSPTATETPAGSVTPQPSGSPTPLPKPRPRKPTPSPTPTLTETPQPGAISRTWDAIKEKFTGPLPTASPTPILAFQAGTPVLLVPGPVQNGYFTTDDHVRLHYLEAGKGGLTLVFIPGWLIPADIWKPQLEGLSQDYHVIALDPRSQGESEITPQGNDPIRQAKDIQELLDHLQLSSVVLVGWSHGGFQVLAYMSQFGTDRLYAAALVDSALGAASSPASTAPRIRFLEQFQKDRRNATAGFIWGLFKKHPPSNFIKKLTDSASRTPTDIALALMNNAFPGENYQPSERVMSQVPLLYAVTPKYGPQAAYLTQVDPQARVEFFTDSGHALFFDEADHFNATMRDFLHHASIYPAGLPEKPHKPVAQPTKGVLK